MGILSNILGAIRSLVGGSMSQAETEAALDNKAKSQSEILNWRESIVDLMKLVGMDSSLPAREQMARELGYTGALDGSADMNIWLHARVMEKIAAGGV